MHLRTMTNRNSNNNGLLMSWISVRADRFTITKVILCKAIAEWWLKFIIACKQMFIQTVWILHFSGADMSQLQRRCGHVGDRPLPAAAVATGRGRANVPCYFTRQRPLHVDQAQQSLLYPFISHLEWMALRNWVQEYENGKYSYHGKFEICFRMKKHWCRNHYHTSFVFCLKDCETSLSLGWGICWTIKNNWREGK